MSSAAPARDLPVLFFQAGDARHLPYTFWQAKHWAGGSPLILLGDESNRHYRGRGLEHVPIRDFASAVSRLRDAYVHISSNSKEFEFFSLARWLVIEEFVRKNGLKEFLYLDSDVLLYEAPASISSRIPTCRMTLAWYGPESNPDPFVCGGQSLIRDPDFLGELCSLMLEFYGNRQKTEFYQVEFSENIKRKQSGISDMWFFGLLAQNQKNSIYNTWQPAKDGLLDINIFDAAGFRSRDGIKEIEFREGTPYGFYETSGRWIRFATLHFGGHTKRFMQKHLSRRPDQNLYWARFRERLGKGLKWHKPDLLFMEAVI